MNLQAGSFQELLDSLTPDIYENLKRAIELGKFPDGRVLNQEQRELCMQAVIAYEDKHMSAEERTGYVPPKAQSAPKCDTKEEDPNVETAIKWQ